MCCCRYKCICLDSVEYVRDCTNHCPPVHMCGRSMALCMRPISSAYVISISSDLCLCNSNKISNNNLLWLLTDLGRTISKISGEVRESCYLFRDVWCWYIKASGLGVHVHTIIPIILYFFNFLSASLYFSKRGAY